MTIKLFDIIEWEKKIQNPFWYDEVPQIIEALNVLRSHDKTEVNKLKDVVYSFFEEKLREGKVALGISGKKWNQERKPIDTIIIHHTSNPEGLSKERLSAIELVRLYAPAYAKRKKREPIYSDHIRNGEQVFWPYHWIIRADGTCDRLLNDNEIGWQAGKWDINCRSIAICIDDDHEYSAPDKKELEVVAGLIKNNYPQVSKDRIFGHCEINLKTTCPSELFLSTPERRGWKDDLLNML